MGIYSAKRGCGRPPRWAQPTRARQGRLCPPSRHPQVQLWPIGFLLVHKKSPWSFVVFGLHVVLIFCEVKNKQKIATGTGHYVNKLVPKMI